MNGRLPLSLIGDAHAYTRSSEPWLLDRDTEAYGETASGAKFGWRLFHYLAGGGLRQLGRTVVQEERLTRQRRFLWIVSALAIVWLALIFL